MEEKKNKSGLPKNLYKGKSAGNKIKKPKAADEDENDIKEFSHFVKGNNKNKWF